MKVEVEDIKPCEKKLSIEVPESKVTAETDKHYRELAKTARVNGFRKGKIPKSVLVQMFGARVRSDIIQEMVPDALSEAMKDNDLRPVKQPLIESVELKTGSPLTFLATVEVLPDFELNDFSSLELTRETIKIKEEDVDKAIERIQENHVVMESAESKQVEKNDYVLFDFAGSIDGVSHPKLKGANQPLIVGKNHFLKELEEGMVGMKPEEKRDIPVPFPESYHDKELAGKEALFSVTINEVKVRKLPELDDAFAKEAGKVSTLKELKENIRKDLERANKDDAHARIKQELIKNLTEANAMDLPDSLIDSETDRIVKNTEQNFARQGIDPSTAGLSTSEMRTKMRDQAIKTLKGELVVDMFSRNASISITEEELEEEVSKIAQSMGDTPQGFKRRLQEQKNMESFKHRMLQDKVKEVMLNRITIKDQLVDSITEESAEESAEE